MLLFWDRQEELQQKSNPLKGKIHQTSLQILATDVSSTCIEHNKERDHYLLQRNNQNKPNPLFSTSIKNNSRLEYATLNVIQPTREEHAHLNKWKPFDLVFDKGGLDTFLFRTKFRRKGTCSTNHPVLHAILRNIYSWLRPSTGIYITITPRPKIKPIRDYRGFAEVERVKLTSMESKDIVAADIESEKNPAVFFAHICRVNDSFDPNEDTQHTQQENNQTPLDSDTCPKCQGKFLQFRGNQSAQCKSGAAWYREWNGHKLHCKGDSRWDGTTRRQRND